ncbi:3-oxoacyl-[acyl-carrier-protein] reductase FabG [Cytospora mali]|uniref:3-oxoacyl-[acyl-carrier-protein] reductase FabG n=1 Tax=Cytospora mali TaxID=578113 RepID=A0A194V4K4_CYTMA|nr:3-oxoacyl-[acyl-carrier-protein] reductase FabG [Valsa mali var. pyri (nom. inval.)]
MISLAGKTVLITGGSRGIGNAIAQRFAKQGARCLLVGRNEANLKTACSDLLPLTAAASWKHTFFSGEVGQAETWDGIVDRLNEEGISVDVLVNAAGVSQSSLLTKTSPLEIESILNTNLRSTVLGCRVIGKQMMKRARDERPNCSILNVSSVMAMRGGTGASVYAASKAGILGKIIIKLFSFACSNAERKQKHTGLTSALSQELGMFQIRVNALVPGYIETQMIENLDKSKLSKQIPLGRVGKAEEVADAAAFLATNSYTNNCVLTIDGGLNAAFRGS